MATKKKSETVALTYVEGKLTVEPLEHEPSASPPHPLAEALSDFLQRLDDIVFAANSMVPASVDILNKRIKNAATTFDKARKTIQSGSPSEASHAGAAIVEAGHTMERLHRSRLPEVVARSLFVNMFSEYDHFFGTLLKVLYRRRPDLLASISKQISFDELLAFQNIDAVKEAVLEAEIDAIRRDSYVDQFATLQKKFGLPLTKFQEWATFVEAAQRRNLMVHCGGHVSEQYLQVCDSVNFSFSTRPNAGDKLSIDQEYFKGTSGVIARVGFMLTHTLWRKVLPDESSTANNELNDQLYKLLCSKRWKLVSDLGTFSLSDPMLNGASDIQHRIRLCNTAIALKNLDKPEEMKRLLTQVDWTASIRDFRLAVAVLYDEYDNAASFMKQIGKRGELVHEVAYHQWPLFGTFRDKPEFHQAYQDVFGYPFYVKAEHSSEAARAQLGDDSVYSAVKSSSPSKERPPKKPRLRKTAAQSNK